MPLDFPSETALPVAASETLTLVPGDLAATKLRRDFDREQQRLGHTVWQPAAVLSWGQWTRSLWSESILAGAEDRLLLNSAQEHSLWREVVGGGAAADSLTSPDALAGLAAAAFRLAAAYGVLPQLQASAATHDARIFAGWAEEFNRLCRREGYLPQASLETAVATHISRGAAAAPATVRLRGFLRQTPEQEKLLAAVRKAGTVFVTDKVSPGSYTAPRDGREVLVASSEKEELRALAAWVRNFLLTETAAGQIPRVAILLPDIDRDRDALQSSLRETLSPELQLIGVDPASGPFELSASGSLASHPMVSAALGLARWAHAPLERERVSALLLSPYVGGPADLDERARFDAFTLRRAQLLHPEVSLATMARLARGSRFGEAALRWLNSLNGFAGNADTFKPQRTHADWTEFLRRLLRAAYWPGEMVTSVDAAALKAWEHALDTVATLDFSGRRVSFVETLHALERQLSAAPLHQPSGDSVVQVLGPTDLPGMHFDALLFARATDNNWPAQERANPLIDWRLQSSLRMPGANRTETAAHARLLTDTILASAPRVLFTYAADTADGKQRLSPLIARLGLPTRDAAEVLTLLPPAEHIEAEVLPDSAPIPALTSPLIHGGASVLQHQAACGFRAFAEIRLRATAPEALEAGLDARERGNLLHNVMKQFWGETKTQKTLQDMPADERQALLRECIDNAMGQNLRHALGRGSDWEQAYLAVQKRRLFRLLEQWLDHELKRGPFEVVAAEEATEVSVGPLDLKVRIDRIDRIAGVDGLEDGLLLVDYKTGYSAKPADWLGERPDEPQLPLYALLPEAGTLAGVAFAKVRPGEGMKWMGYASHDGVLPGKNTVQPLAELTEEWRAHLTTLAEAFAAGDTGVRPKEYPVTCAHCGQRLLCRLDSATLLAVSEDAGLEADEAPSETAH